MPGGTGTTTGSVSPPDRCRGPVPGATPSRWTALPGISARRPRSGGRLGRHPVCSRGANRPRRAPQPPTVPIRRPPTSRRPRHPPRAERPPDPPRPEPDPRRRGAAPGLRSPPIGALRPRSKRRRTAREGPRSPGGRGLDPIGAGPDEEPPVSAMGPKCTAPRPRPGSQGMRRGTAEGPVRRHALVDRDARRHVGHRPLRRVGEGGVERGRGAHVPVRAASAATDSRARARAPTSPGGTSTPCAPTTARYPGRSLATRAARAAMASSSTTPKDSPPSDGAHSACAPARRDASSWSSTRPNHTSRALPADGAAAAPRYRAPPPPPTRRRRRRGSPDRAGRGRLEQDGEALALFMAADEDDGGAGGGMGRRAGEALDVDAVADDLVVAPEGASAPWPRLRSTPHNGPPVGPPRPGPADRAAGRRCPSRSGGTSPPWADRTPRGRRSRGPAPAARAGAPRRSRPLYRTPHGPAAHRRAGWPSATGATDPLKHGHGDRPPSRTRDASGGQAAGRTSWSSSGASTTASWPASARSAPARPSTWPLDAAGPAQAVGAQQRRGMHGIGRARAPELAAGPRWPCHSASWAGRDATARGRGG